MDRLKELDNLVGRCENMAEAVRLLTEVCAIRAAREMRKTGPERSEKFMVLTSVLQVAHEEAKRMGI